MQQPTNQPTTRTSAQKVLLLLLPSHPQSHPHLDIQLIIPILGDCQLLLYVVMQVQVEAAPGPAHARKLVDQVTHILQQ